MSIHNSFNLQQLWFLSFVSGYMLSTCVYVIPLVAWMPKDLLCIIDVEQVDVCVSHVTC